MTIRQLLFLVLTMTAGCHSPGHEVRAKELIATDTNKPVPALEKRAGSSAAILLKTHLKDTSYVFGNVILFLRPDAARYDSLAADEENGMGDGDSDFGVGISNTTDSVTKNKRYKARS